MEKSEPLYVMSDIQDMSREAVRHPYTGDVYLDDALKDYANLVGHDNPYYKLFWMLSREYQPDNVVELGSYRGNGAASFASGGIMSVVATIDIHREDKDAQSRCKTMADHYHNLFYINAWTWDAVPQVQRSFSPINVLYIDAWHEYEYATREWKLYRPLLADEALVICDDIFDADGATVDMERFWSELEGEWKFLDTDVHSGIPMGFMRWVRGQSNA